MTNDETRIGQIIEANVLATHAFQVLVARKDAGLADSAAWRGEGLSSERLQDLVERQKRLVSAPDALRAWCRGEASAFDPAQSLRPILDSGLHADDPALPINAVTAWLRERAPQARSLDVRAVAGLMQMAFDVGRDGDVLQDLFRLYHALGLKVHPGQLGLSTASDEACLALGRELAPRLAKGPFAVDSATLQMLFRKLDTWGRRHTGERDKRVLAREWMAEPEVQALLPALRALPPMRIAVIGHSYTMDVHWSSPSAFVPVVAEMLKSVNPGIEIRHWSAGGLSATRALRRDKFYEAALAWKPDRVLMVLAVNTPEDRKALDEMIRGFREAGAKVTMFDRYTPAGAQMAWDCVLPPDQAGVEVMPVGRRLAESPDRDRFFSLDHVHMTEPYHRLMAKTWLAALAGKPEK